ncbi:YggS family pyridoxal phosphate-dependent enzyme [Moraxella sp. Tifton1]|uniref:YggS family pyridoxal phosphate-dependent enzyme n=1 Tax=Moraxella oculi TaxID=2940516 RepID=UPI0020130993|nr:YggS family pyridoxal phosphate-dependent enzyme [Moraxella sp. Tifton1]MCL1623154.1 YggS family pyridoxal phosphate-dependent enzyme [Moraxella sp. Tifton1]
MNDNQLIQNYRQVTSQLKLANQQSNAKSVATLLAVSKTKPDTDIRTLFMLGQRDFGENYLQEALEKQAKLTDLPIIWHYIGSIQRNKTKDIAKNFDWVHTIERELVAKRLNDQRGDLPPLNVLIQINIDGEATKSGVRPNELLGLVHAIKDLPNLRLRGIMVIPNQDGSDAFLRTKLLFDEVGATCQLADWNVLSMGMSGDMVEAVACGSTIVRVGTALFGARE